MIKTGLTRWSTEELETAVLSRSLDNVQMYEAERILRERELARKLVGRPQIVVIEKRNPVRRCGGDPAIARTADARRACVAHVMDVRRSQFPKHRCRCWVPTVIDNEHFEGYVLLPENAA